MAHPANMNTRNSLACGHKAWEKNMSREDIEFVSAHPATFRRDPKGFWINANLDNKRDRDFRAAMWAE